MGLFQYLLVRVTPPLPVAGVLLPSMYLCGAGFTVFRPVRAGDESRPALRAPLRTVPVKNLRFQRLILWQDRPPEPLAADGIGNRLRAGMGIPIVQQKAVTAIIVTTGIPYERIAPPPLCRRHAGQGAARPALNRL